LLQTLLLNTHSLVVPLPVLPCSRKAQRTHREAPSPLGTSNEGLKCLLLGGSCSGACCQSVIQTSSSLVPHRKTSSMEISQTHW
ncbi:hypothetical protein HGM15179_002254, partial [Zosterops borbonicus]